MTELNELSELQSVDFAFGAFLAGAFAGYADKGPQGWRNFIKRPVNKQIFRHDADTPEQFMRDFLSSQKDKKVTSTRTNDEDVVISSTFVNAPLFPVVYYFRKPGLVNTQDQKGSRGRVWNGNRIFDLQQLPVALDYNLVLMAWDKLALDKISLAWYAYVSSHDAFMAPFEIGGESFDVRVSLMDNKNIAMQNASEVMDGKRLYAATTPVSIMTNILFGKEIDLPGPSRVIFGSVPQAEQRYVLTLADDLFSFDSATKEDGPRPINPGTVRLMVGARVVATDDGKGAISGSYELDDIVIPIVGTVDYYSGIISVSFGSNPAGVVSVAFQPLDGRINVDWEFEGDGFYDDGGIVDYDDGQPMVWG